LNSFLIRHKNWGLYRSRLCWYYAKINWQMGNWQDFWFDRWNRKARDYLMKLPGRMAKYLKRLVIPQKSHISSNGLSQLWYDDFWILNKRIKMLDFEVVKLWNSTFFS
jgi:hypothetical protein